MKRRPLVLWACESKRDPDLCVLAPPAGTHQGFPDHQNTAVKVSDCATQSSLLPHQGPWQGGESILKGRPGCCGRPGEMAAGSSHLCGSLTINNAGLCGSAAPSFLTGSRSGAEAVRWSIAPSSDHQCPLQVGSGKSETAV